MTYLQVVNLILARMGNRNDLRAAAELELVDVQENIIEKETQFHPWFLVTDDWQDLAITSGSASVALPSDFLMPGDNGFCYYVLADGSISTDPLTRRTFPDARVRNADADEMQVTGSDPKYYDLVGSNIHIWPVPDRNITLKIRYYQAQTTLNNSSPATHPILLNAADWLLNEAGSRVAEAAQHMDALRLFQTRAQRARQRVQAETIEREMSDTEYYSGGEL